MPGLRGFSPKYGARMEGDQSVLLSHIGVSLPVFLLPSPSMYSVEKMYSDEILENLKDLKDRVKNPEMWLLQPERNKPIGDRQ